MLVEPVFGDKNRSIDLCAIIVRDTRSIGREMLFIISEHINDYVGRGERFILDASRRTSSSSLGPIA